MTKIDQRKTASEETNLKKADAGRKGKGRSAFVAKVVVKSSEVKLQERIEKVVEMAKAREAAKLLGQDVIRYNRHPLLLSRMQAHKIA